MLKKYSFNVLNDLTETAKAAQRKRMNLNIHESTDASVQRLFMAVEPDTYIRPHRHPQAHKWELFIILEGEMDLLLFNDAGEIMERIALSASETRAVEIPPDTWHSYISKKSGTQALEIKQGAYLPTPEEDFLSLAPAENTAETTAYLQWMRDS